MTTSTVLPSFSHDQRHKTDAAKRKRGRRGHYVKNDMESLGLSQKDAQFRNKWRRIIKGATG